jgi:glycosyltransferase involved in cell wall biosynthesis
LVFTIFAAPFRKDPVLTCTVIICTRNRPAFLRKCLEAITALDPAADAILVVDNSQGDPETEAVAREFSAGYVIEPCAGLSSARNRGLAESKTDIVAYLDDDAIASPDWLGSLLAPFKDEEVAAATGRILTPESRPLDRERDRPRLVSNKDPHWFEMATFGGLGLGSNMALRKSACNGWTAFDTRLGRGAPFEIAEENYAFASLLSRGYTAAYLPDAIVTHPSLRRRSIVQEARASFAYWLLLFAEFPARRFDLIRFLFRRLRRKQLAWPRDSQDPGEVITSSRTLQLRAALSALLLFIRTKRPTPPR